MGSIAAPQGKAAANDKQGASISGELIGYVVPDDQDFVLGILGFDYRWLHVGFRYNYEALRTASWWLGYNFHLGQDLEMAFTPMFGAVIGEVDGFGPGFTADLSYWLLTLYSESQYIFDVGDSNDSYLYTWNEFTLSPLDWFFFGLSVQRTRVYQTELDLHRGLVAGIENQSLGIAAYLFDVPWDSPTFVVSLYGTIE